ncbi:FAD-dependent oxidoreductase [Actinokineospora auranticolor]|uniref:NADH dehydrogenase FAD-containing subunit n=1 Tax=Actinokineospora auranticolor TaxID=155976 RepID=A0A2S6GSX9_9PSEU|nr:FAD-dependent oxidoreductase [Actinokineospora auranticolor]PPK68296.1 NADH dehydrogenase FAD-containing subunit [Actinokineospora auranticolor]
MHKIVVLGAGYAGMAAAVNLAGRTRRRADVEITVVNATARFTERLRLHQAAAGQELADLRIADVLGDNGITLVYGWVTAVDAAARTVRIDDERVLHYDTLVYALGGVSDTGAVPGAADHAHTFDSAHDAEALARRLATLGTGTVAVCGGGLTGVEAAAEIAEAHPGLDVVLLGRAEPGVGLAPKAKAYVDAALARLGVRVRSGVEIVKVLPDSVVLDDDAVPADVVLWTSGVRVSPLAAEAGLAVDERGRVVTDESLRSVSHPDVYVVGDAAAVRQGYGTLTGTCQSGMPTGVHAAISIVRELEGKRPKAFRFGYLHCPVSLGRGDAVVQFTRPDNSPKRSHLTGRRAVWYKETVSAGGWASFGRMSRFPVLGTLGWRRGGRYTR